MRISEKEILRKYIAGNCTEKELEKVREIMSQPNFNTLVDEILSEYGNPIKASIESDSDMRMQNWTELISRRIANDMSYHQQSFKKPFFFRYAAVWIIMTMAAGLWGVTQVYQSKHKLPATAYIVKFNPSGKRTKLILPDSSVILLGSASRLRYPEHFTGTTREISLEGEAFFDVKKNPKKPFIIHTSEIRTKVLGTSFKITSFKGRPLSVSVATGRVAVDRFIGKQVQSLAVLTPGRRVVYSQGKVVTDVVDIDELTEWKEGHLVHAGKPLKEIAEELERWYAVKIEIKNAEIARMPMDINITANIPIDRVMKVLSISGGFKYSINGNIISIH